MLYQLWLNKPSSKYKVLPTSLLCAEGKSEVKCASNPRICTMGEQRPDKFEPILMDEEILKEAVENNRPKDAAGRTVKVEGVTFNDIPTLCLHFRSKKKHCSSWS